VAKEILLKSISLPNNETLGYRECGEGDKTFLLIHGNMTSSKHWDLVLEAIPENYKVYAVDLRGFGISTYNSPITSIKDLSDDLKLFADALDLKDFILVGWSLGGCVSMQFVVDNPEYASKLILMESGSTKGFPLEKRNIFRRRTGEMLKTKEEIAKAITPLLNAVEKKNKFLLKAMCNKSLYNVNKPSREKFQEYIDDILTQRNLLDVNHALSYFNISYESNGVIEGTGEVGKINIPTLVIHGDMDKLVPLSTAKRTKALIGHNAKLVILGNCGHSPVIDKLEEIIKLFTEFIN
jgi:pimeloyl-ACP methyl ester carboxylesterase